MIIYPAVEEGEGVVGSEWTLTSHQPAFSQQIAFVIHRALAGRLATDSAGSLSSLRVTVTMYRLTVTRCTGTSGRWS